MLNQYLQTALASIFAGEWQSLKNMNSQGCLDSGQIHLLLFYNFLQLCTKILDVNLFAFAYRLFHEDFSSIDGAV